MAEKTRQKEANDPEAGRAAAKAAPDGFRQGRRLKAPRPRTVDTEIAEEFSDGSDQVILPSAQELAEKLLDRKPLNFGKYELPKRPAAQTREPAPAAEPAVPKAEAPRPKPEKKPEPRADTVFDPTPEPAPTVMEYTFESFEEPKSAPVETYAAPEPETDELARPRARRNSRRQAAPPPDPSLNAPNTQPPRDETPEPPTEGPAGRKSDREDFLKRISSEFEQEFNEKFERRESAPKPAAAAATPRPAPPRGPQQQNPGRVFPDQPLRENRVEPDEPELFISKFRQDVAEEETRRAEDFKETLAQKFLRERERYLKELGIDAEPDEEPHPEGAAEPEPPQRRKLDFQIQPEMHMGSGEAPPAPPAAVKPKTPAAPVTYTRGGGLRPLDAEPDDDATETFPARPAPTTPRDPVAAAQADTAPQGKKSSEQLLLELGRARARLAQPAPQKTAAPPPKLNLTFETPEEQAKKQKTVKRGSLLPEGKWPRLIAVTLIASAVLSVALLAGSLYRYSQLGKALAEPDVSSSAPPSVQQATLEVYESKSFGQRAHVDNVIFKKPDATLKNVSVKEYVVIDGIASEGKIRLEDMSVDAAISVKNCGINALELHNVTAQRVIINNASKNVTVTATGSTDVAVVEIRTPAAVVQTSITGDMPGVRGVTITAGEGGSSNLRLDGLNLQTLSAENDTVLVFQNNTRAETMSVAGSLSLTGAGRAESLAIGAKIMQGAGDLADPAPVNLILKGVDVGTLNIKSAASLNIAANVDNLATSDSISLVGNGAVGTFALNPRFGSGRLLVDLADLTVQYMYANTPVRLNATGTARVNTLTADESVYALGNKVNHLVVNADGVIYENEPDRMTVAPDVRPPQTKAEKPNIDYSLGTAPGALDYTGEDLATTCGHPRESGGFIVGDGSKDAPFEIDAPAQLAHISAHLASYFKQTGDIDISTESKFSGGFPMIASGGAPFEGMFDGGGFQISNLRVISPDENVGLFAENKGVIENVRLVSGDISANGSDRQFAGGIAGLNYEGGMIRSCSNGAVVTGNQNTYAGGIAGYNFGARVHDCYNYAKISGVDTVGGLVGMNRSNATLTGSYNAGNVSGRSDTGAVAGKNDDATIANCYFLTGTADAGIGTGGGTAMEKTSGELQDPQIAADLAAGNEDSLWIPGETSSGGYHYPMLRQPGR